MAQPELIRVTTLSAKIVDQLPYLDGLHLMSSSKPIDFADLEIIGQLDNSVIVRAKTTGHLGRMRCLAYLTELMDTHKLSNADANRQFALLPQLFTT